MAIDFQRVQSAFAAAVEASGDERAAILVRECGSDLELLKNVEELLRAHDDSHGFLNRPAGVFDPRIAATLPPEELTDSQAKSGQDVGNRIGPYKLLQQIGEGGMGTVWMAEQQEPVQRMVALKVIKAGMDSSQVLARFEAERQALALMDHPNIAKVHDGGQTESGRPYFVMELVKGMPITKYCDEHRLPPAKRLELFVQACRALQHAHQKGIIHRDIKPSNVLVAPYDGTPVVKVIDFGVAKAMGQRLTERTMFTEFGAVVGTLQYMSPEQAELNNQDIDTRSDVYSLGVLLYELLTGTTPLDLKRLGSAALAAVLMAIHEDEPPRPSTRLSDSADSLPSIAAMRHMEPAKLTRLVRGDLDWIAMKALEKDRRRRYETANALARDVERHLTDEPVEACPPSAAYRLRKFAHKHRGSVLATAVVMATLLLGISGTTTYAIRATRLAKEKDDEANRANLQARLARESEAAARSSEAKSIKSETDAKASEASAKKSEAKAKAAKRESDMRLYGSDIQIAESHYLSNQFGQMKQVLDRYARAYEEGDDPRGFEWRYLQARLRDDLLTMEGRAPFTSVCFSPSGDHLASGNYDHTIKLWDRRTGALRTTLEGHENRVNSVCFSPLGDRLASASDDKTVAIWDVRTGQRIATLKDQNGRVFCACFSPSGDRLASAGADKTVRIWDARTWQCLATHRIASSFIWQICFHPAGDRLAAALDFGGVQILDARTGIVKTTFPETMRTVKSVCFSPCGNRLAAASNDSIRIWNATTGKLELDFKAHHRTVTSIRFNPTGDRIVSASDDATIKLWDARTGTLQATLAGHAEYVIGVCFSPGGECVASASGDNTLKIWDAPLVKSRSTFRGKWHERVLTTLAFSPTGERLASGSEDKTIKLWDAKTGQLERTLYGHTGALTDLWFSGTGDRLASSSNDKTVKLWDVQTGRNLVTLRGPSSNIIGVSFGPNGARIASGHFGGTVKLWGASEGEILATRNRRDWGTSAVAFSRTGDRLAVLTLDNNVAVLDANTLELKFKLDANSKYRRYSGSSPGHSSICFSSNGDYLASTCDDKTIKLWDARAGRLLATLSGHTASLTCMSFSPTGDRLASGSDDKTVKLWDGRSGQLLATLSGHESVVSGICFHPSGNYLVSTGWDSKIIVWDARSDPAARGDDRIRKTVDALFLLPLTQSEVVRKLETEPILPDDLKPAAIESARQRPDSGPALAFRARHWSLFASLAPAVRRRGLELSQRACELSKDSDSCLEALAASLFRLDRFDESIAAFKRRRKRPYDAEITCIEAMAWKAVGKSDIATICLADAQSRANVLSQDQKRAFASIFDEAKFSVFGSRGHEMDLAGPAKASEWSRRLVDTPNSNSEAADLVRLDKDAGGEMKRLALAALERLPEQDAAAFNSRAWSIAKENNGATTGYQRAIDWALIATAKSPENGNFVNTLGVAYYRARMYQEALAILIKSEKLNAKDGVAHPSDSAFLAMTLHRLGRFTEAQAALERCRQALSRPTQTANGDARKFLAEAESLVANKAK